MTTFIEREEVFEEEIVPVRRPGVEITRRKRPTVQEYDPEIEDDVIRLPVPSPGMKNPDIIDLLFIPQGGEIWNFSFQPVLLQLQSFRTPNDVQSRYDIAVNPFAYFTWGWPEVYAKTKKLGFYVEGLHTGIAGVVTIVACHDRRPTEGGSLVQGISTGFDVEEQDVPADGAFHVIQLPQPALSIELDSLPNGANPANTAQMLSVQVTSDANGISGSLPAFNAATANWSNAFTLAQAPGAGLVGGTKAWNGLVTAVQVKVLGASAGRVSVQNLPD